MEEKTVIEKPEAEESKIEVEEEKTTVSEAGKIAKPEIKTPATEKAQGTEAKGKIGEKSKEETALEPKPTAPKSILFDLQTEDGTRREVTAQEVLDKMSAFDKAVQVLDDNKKINEINQTQRRNLVTNPLQTALDWISFDKFEGDRDAAYEYLMGFVEAAYEERQKYMELPAEQRLKMEYERKIKVRDEKLNQIKNQQTEEIQATAEAERIEKFKKEADAAIAEFSLPNTDESYDLIIRELKRQRDAGRKPNMTEAAKLVQAIYEKREEGHLKVVPLERLLKARPELAKAIEKEKLEKTKKERAEEEIKKSSPKSSPGQKEPVSHRVPISRWI